METVLVCERACSCESRAFTSAPLWCGCELRWCGGAGRVVREATVCARRVEESRGGCTRKMESVMAGGVSSAVERVCAHTNGLGQQSRLRALISARTKQQTSLLASSHPVGRVVIECTSLMRCTTPTNSVQDARPRRRRQRHDMASRRSRTFPNSRTHTNTRTPQKHTARPHACMHARLQPTHPHTTNTFSHERGTCEASLPSRPIAELVLTCVPPLFSPSRLRLVRRCTRRHLHGGSLTLTL